MNINNKDLKLCSNCILPETFPYIEFDEFGICNYCNNHKKQTLKNIADFKETINNYKNNEEYDCIIPLSGGRDSYFTLIYAVKELNLKPITYTYDWGMMTDVAKENIETITQLLDVPNIMIKANHKKKLKNIRKNLNAWLYKPDISMLNILSAGDKHFFKYINKIKKEHNIKLNIWGVNPYEITHFKSGFLGIEPEIQSDKVYTTGFKKQIKYQYSRFKRMFKNRKFLNLSLFDTLSGEFYRSIKKKQDYFHLFDYYKWDEKEVEKTIFDYGFKKIDNIETTWRIGDGTASFYDYVYYNIAGFSEHDTFRSNQIRDGIISRDQALFLSRRDNEPKWELIEWYIKRVGLNYDKTIDKLDEIFKNYKYIKKEV